MHRSERVKALGGPGGLRCPCCEAGGGRREAWIRRRLARAGRRRDKRRALAEGAADRDE